jgi:peptide/nickel transport system substrate-binding protein
MVMADTLRPRVPAVGCAVAVVLLLALAACGGRRPADPSVIVVAMANSPSSFDPRVGSDEASQKIHQLIYNDLFTLDDELRVVPDLAAGDYEMPDDLTYHVGLREGIRFHDGRELTAADVVYTFESFLNPDFVSPRKGAYRLLESVRAIDRYTIEFRLNEPFGSFPINLVMGIVPAGSGSRPARDPIGTGPYRLASYTPDDRVVLEPFEEHFRGAPRNGGLVLKTVPDDTMRGLELRKGTVDLVVNDLSPDITHQLQREGRLQVATGPGADYMYVGMNLRDPTLADVRVRQAIGFAIDRAAIVEHLRRGLAEPAVGVLPPVSWAFEPDVFSFAYDPERAKRLLDEAGYPDSDGEGGLPRLRLSLKTSTAEFVRLQAAAIQQDLRRVGIALDVRSYEFATLYSDVLRGNFQLFTLQWVGVSDPDMLRRVFHSGQMPPAGFNRGFYSHPAVDRLIDAATQSTDDAARRELYAEAQRVIARDVPYISLWYRTNVAVSQPDIRGVRLTPTARFEFLKDVYRAPVAPGSETPGPAPAR